MNGADAVAIKALIRIFRAWKLGGEASARLAGVSERTWARMQAGRWAGTLSQDQTLRASALVGLYKGLQLHFGAELADAWVSLANRGPLFRGSAPVDFMMMGGLPAIMETRDYVDAVRGEDDRVAEGAGSTEPVRAGDGHSTKPIGERRLRLTGYLEAFPGGAAERGCAPSRDGDL